jgi:hypothetical protein
MRKQSLSAFSNKTIRKNARRRRRNLLLLCVCLVVSAVAVSGFFSSSRKVTAATGPTKAAASRSALAAPPQTDITADALRQIEALEAEKESRTPAQRKLSSALLQTLRESRGQRMAAGVQLESTNVKADASGLIVVDITATVSDVLLANIVALGGEIIFPSAEYKAIRVRVPLSSVETIAGYSDVSFIRTATPAKTSRTIAPATDASSTVGSINSPGSAPTFAPFVSPYPPTLTARRLSFAERAARVRSQLINLLATRSPLAPLPIGKATSSGDKAHQSDTAKTQYGFAGEGIRIGVMSDSFNYLGGAGLDVSGGDLPGPGNPFGNTTPVTVVQDLPIPNGIVAGSDEGRAMVQIVHDIAPKAQLFFASAFISEAGFATNIKRLRDAPNNCDIVIDDVSYSDEGVFQDSVVAQAVNYVTASGGLYFSSAGNEGNIDRATASAWEGDFNDAGSTFVVPGNSKGGTVHNFGTVGTPVNGNILITASGFVYSLDWSDPLGASSNDYDLFVVNTAGTTVKAASTNVQSGTIDPHEEIASTAFNRVNGDRLVIFKTTGAAVRALNLNANGGRLTVPTTGNTHGHGSAVDAFSVAAAAASAANTVGGVFTSASRVETFSSDGPRRIFYNVNGTPVTPGNILFATNGGVVRQKPDITAADAVATSGNSLGAGLNPFSGTSAAAPHAGAIAGLIKSANPALTSAQIRTILTAAANTIPIEVVGAGAAPNAVAGYGIINANAAVAAAAGQQADLALGTVTQTENAYSNTNTIIEPGEYANVVVQLTNPSLTNALNVNATLSSATAGVSIIQGAASYGTIAAGGNATNTGTPFVVAIDQSFACGSPITLSVAATLTNGTTLVSPITFTVGGTVAPLVPTISSNLSLAPPAGAGYTAVDGTKTGTLARNAIQATCALPKSAPLSGTGFSTTTGGRFVAYTFANPGATNRCINITATSGTAANLQTATFNNAGFVPATSLSAGTNYLADSGTRAASMVYSFVLPGSQSFTTVIYDATNGGTAGATTYTLTVNLAPCAGAPACTPVSIMTASIASGATGVAYSQAFAATGGSGSYVFSLTGALPAGLSFSGNTLSGTPTQAGTFPITITAVDPAGCPTGTQNYSLVIAGNAPASLAVNAGDPQTVLPGAVFPTALKAIVRDGANAPLSGVGVTFTAPPSGASGTFLGGVKSVMVVSDASGIATAPTFTANTTAGSYAVTASVANLAPVNFNLSNTCPGSFVVTTNADSGPGSLRDIVNNACPGATVTFAANVTGTIALTTGELAINKSITIVGPGADQLAISGNFQSRVISIAASIGTVGISGLTIRDGATKADGSDFYGGGGVLIVNGTVNLTSCLITNNNATSSGNPDGGGVDNEGGTVTISRCAITNNTVTNNVASNGAFYFGGGVFSEGTAMTIDQSTITGNMCAPFGNGGGLAFFTNVTLTNSTVYGNGANGGGNILRAGGTLTFKNNIIGGGLLTGVNGAGLDISGAGFNSQDYNLIQTTTGGTITGTTTHNLTGNPALLPLGNYGGPIPSMLPAPNSPALNAGDTALVSGTDQRGLPRFVGGQADIGAVETNYSLAASGGASQGTTINTPFPTALQATAQESGNGISGLTVTFTAPGSNPSGTFPGPASAANVVTGPGGVATAPTFTAGGTTGGYFVTATIGPAIPLANYSLANFGPTASNGRITGRIVDNQNAPVAGAAIKLSGGQSRETSTDADGFYRFDNVPTGAFYYVTPVRVNYSFSPAARAFSQIGESTEAVFLASLATSGFVNPLDTPEYFVRQHYLDFLGREPDEAGFNFWSDQILECGADTACAERRTINVSAAYFLSIEFMQTGGFVDGLYRASFGHRPQYAEFMPDTRTVAANIVVGAPDWSQTLTANKQAFLNAWVQRPNFRAAYDGLTNGQYVDALINHTGVSFASSERDALVNSLMSGAATRGEVLGSIAENGSFVSAKRNEMFVMMQYFGYLRRDPDASGFAFWLNKLNQFGGNFEQAEMVKAFIVSGEYRNRFAP